MRSELFVAVEKPRNRYALNCGNTFVRSSVSRYFVNEVMIRRAPTNQHRSDRCSFLLFYILYNCHSLCTCLFHPGTVHRASCSSWAVSRPARTVRASMTNATGKSVACRAPTIRACTRATSPATGPSGRRWCRPVSMRWSLSARRMSTKH